VSAFLSLAACNASSTSRATREHARSEETPLGRAPRGGKSADDPSSTPERSRASAGTAPASTSGPSDVAAPSGATPKAGPKVGARATKIADEEDEKIVRKWLYGSDAAEAMKGLEKLFADKPELAKSGQMLMEGLDDAGIAGELGARGRKLAELALEKGADPNGADEAGLPLLVHYAMFFRTVPMEILLTHGASPDVGDADGRTALVWIATHEEDKDDPGPTASAIAAAKLLADHGASLGARDKRGDTALHVAAHNGARQMVELLLERGADMNAVDDDGYSPLGMASLRIEQAPGQPSFANDKEKAATREVIELLAQRGAKDLRKRF
jgi:hypothetical protein